jgi:hypothetical protein
MPSPPSFHSTTKLVARALGITPAQLRAGLRPACLADLPAVLSLRNLEFGASIAWDDGAYLSWRYRLGRQNLGLGDLWIVVNGAGSLLGMIGTEDMVCSQSGQRWVGVRAMDILVNPEAKNTGLGIWLNQALFDRYDFVLAVGSNPNSIGMLRRLYQTLLPGLLYHRYVDFHRYAKWRLGNEVAAWLAARIVNFTMRNWRRLWQIAIGGRLSIKPVYHFDDAIGVLLANGQVGPLDIVIEHTPAYLNRRLFENPRARYEVWGVYQQGTWLGYIAYRIAHRGDGEKWLYIVDLHVDFRQRTRTLGALLCFTTRQAELQLCSFIGISLQGGICDDAFRAHGFLGPKGEQTVTVHAEDPSLLRALSLGKWSLTDLSFDGDGC